MKPNKGKEQRRELRELVATPIVEQLVLAIWGSSTVSGSDVWITLGKFIAFTIIPKG